MRVRSGSVHTHSANACSTVWRFWYSSAVACGSRILLFPVGSFGSGLVRLLVVALSAPDTTSNGLRPAPVPRPYFRMVSSSSFDPSDALTCQLPVVSSWLTVRLRMPPSVMLGCWPRSNVSIMKSRITPVGIHAEPSFAVMSSWVSRAGSDRASRSCRDCRLLRRSVSAGSAGWESIHAFRRLLHCSRPSMSTISSNGLNVFWSHEL